jgi:hypothetical protein
LVRSKKRFFRRTIPRVTLLPELHRDRISIVAFNHASSSRSGGDCARGAQAGAPGRATVDLAFDDKEDIDALDRLGRDRRFGEPREIEEPAPAVRPARHLVDLATLTIGSWSLLTLHRLRPASARHSLPIEAPGSNSRALSLIAKRTQFSQSRSKKFNTDVGGELYQLVLHVHELPERGAKQTTSLSSSASAVASLRPVRPPSHVHSRGILKMKLQASEVKRSRPRKHAI